MVCVPPGLYLYQSSPLLLSIMLSIYTIILSIMQGVSRQDNVLASTQNTTSYNIFCIYSWRQRCPNQTTFPTTNIPKRFVPVFRKTPDSLVQYSAAAVMLILGDTAINSKSIALVKLGEIFPMPLSEMKVYSEESWFSLTTGEARFHT